MGWVSAEKINCLIFERKNEYHPHLQTTSFFDDAKVLKELFPSESFRFGNADEHHLYMMSLSKPFVPPVGDTTLEVLMYDLHPDVQMVLGKPHQSPEVIRELIGRGHRIEYNVGSYGGYQAIMYDNENDVYYGASESRKDGMAAGY